MQAVTATVAVRGGVPACWVYGFTLIDGGVLDPVLWRLARWLAPHLAVPAVVLSPAVPRITTKATQALPIPGPKPLVDTIARLRLSQAIIFTRAQWRSAARPPPATPVH